ncbi:hypothetical protein [Phocaeicola sp.]
MIRKLTSTLFIILCLALSMQAQNKKPGFSKEEFRAKQEAYLTGKAELTKEEATKFFPVYFELQDRKKAINDKAWQKARKGKDSDTTTEEEYEEIIDGIANARLEADKLDVEYLQRFKKILSSKKLFKLQRAEVKFHRDLLKIMHQPQKREEKKK